MSASSSQGGQSTEDALFEAMDRQAKRLIDMLENTEKDEDGNDKYDIQLKMKFFEMGQNWLIRRAKLRPASGLEEGSGISDMRAWINDPAARAILKDAMFEEGFVRMPPRKTGRPKREDQAAMARYKDFESAQKVGPNSADDSGLRAMLNGKDPS